MKNLSAKYQQTITSNELKPLKSKHKLKLFKQITGTGKEILYSCDSIGFRKKSRPKNVIKIGATIRLKTVLNCDWTGPKSQKELSGSLAP